MLMDGLKTEKSVRRGFGGVAVMAMGMGRGVGFSWHQEKR